MRGMQLVRERVTDAQGRPVSVGWQRPGWTVEIADREPFRRLPCGHTAAYGCDCDTIAAEAEAT